MRMDVDEDEPYERHYPPSRGSDVPILPPELFIHILEDPTLSKETLAACSLVSRSFYHMSRAQLYRAVTIARLQNDRLDVPGELERATQAFEFSTSMSAGTLLALRTLLENPPLRSYARELELDRCSGGASAEVFDQMVPFLPNIDTVVLSRMYSGGLDKLIGSSLTSLSTLRTLHINQHHLPLDHTLTILEALPTLQHLEFTSVNLDNPQSFPSLPKFRLQTLAINASLRGHVSSEVLAWLTSASQPTLHTLTLYQKYLKRHLVLDLSSLPALRHLNLTADPWSSDHNLLPHFLSAQLRTTRNLSRLRVTFVDEPFMGYNPLLSVDFFRAMPRTLRALEVNVSTPLTDLGKSLEDGDWCTRLEKLHYSHRTKDEDFADNVAGLCVTRGIELGKW
ncbi:hypothetical protein MNV49_001229 [Pseudohyphozyma bogoriensis]|nr:hypothetical protein MNV49_001229 [Pseudohyphozyma bogoriensis]